MEALFAGAVAAVALWFRQQRCKSHLPKCKTTGDARRIITCTRYWGKTKSDLKRLDDFIQRAAEYSAYIIIAIRSEQDRSGAESFLTRRYHGQSRVMPLPVTPWGDVTTALNSMLIRASCAKFRQEFILFQSLEIISSAHHIQEMFRHMQSDTLVVGAALEGHQFMAKQGDHEAEVEIGGLTSPWNTCALWHRPSLALT